MPVDVLLALVSVFLFCLTTLALLFYFPPPWRKGKGRAPLPPGPPTVPLLGNLNSLPSSFSALLPHLHRLHGRYGPILTLHIGRRPAVFVADHALAHRALVQGGALFADRPPARGPNRVITSDQHNVSFGAYGPLWRCLRRNLVTETLHPSRVRAHAGDRRWVLGVLLGRLRAAAGEGPSVGGAAVVPMESFRFAMFCLLVLMCFGERLEEGAIREIEVVQRKVILSVFGLNFLNFLPEFVAMVFFRKSWKKLLSVRRRQEEILLPLIRARRSLNQSLPRHQRPQQCQQEGDVGENKSHFRVCYVDTLLDLEIPEGEGRKLSDCELVTLCSEFLNAGTDTTSTALQWIMANVVKHQEIQKKLAEEIQAAAGRGEEVEEDDLRGMPYLKAVILEGLRRHPPGQFVLPHAVSEETTLAGYTIPRGATVNFEVATMGCDAKVWEEPMEFRPERFLPGGEGVDVDVTGSREIKMMPFGAGRRICPGLGLAMLHLEYFVANLVRAFEWKPVDGEDVDLSEKAEFTTVMKHPLRAGISPRQEQRSREKKFC